MTEARRWSLHVDRHRFLMTDRVTAYSSRRSGQSRLQMSTMG